MTVETLTRTKILLADGHYLVRQGIIKTLEEQADFDVVADADNGARVIKLAQEHTPDVVIIDDRLSKIRSAEVVKRIKSDLPKTKILILRASDDEEHVATIVAAGACGSLEKTASGDTLIQAIRTILAGGFYCDMYLANKVFRQVSFSSMKANPGEYLNKREHRMLKMAAYGMSNREISIREGLTEGTIKGYFSELYDKIGVHSRTEAVMMAIKHGWIEVEFKPD